MLLTDLFEKLEPGDRKAIDLKIADAQRAIRDIEQHQSMLGSLNNVEQLPGTEKELEDLKKAYEDYIAKLQAKLDADKDKKDRFDKYVQAILRHCPTVVETCKKTNMFLYRGTKEDAAAFYGKPFDNRRAKDSHGDYHEAFNTALKNVGVEARRDNSMFCTTNRHFAQGFGNELYIIFPRDPFHFTWSDKIKDLILNSENMGDMVDPALVEMLMGYVWDDEKIREKFLERWAWQSGYPPTEAKWDPSEIGSNSSYKYIFSKSGFSYSFNAFSDPMVIGMLPEKLHKYADFKNWADGETIIKNFGLKIDQDLEGAFNQRYEITIRSEYYAVKANLERRLRAALGMKIDNRNEDEY